MGPPKMVSWTHTIPIPFPFSKPLTGWCSTPTQLLICSSFNRENGHPLLICSSLSTAQLKIWEACMGRMLTIFAGPMSLGALKRSSLLGWSPQLGYVVNNHGDRFRPLRIGLWDPFQMAVSWLINRGDPNHLLTNWDDPPSGLRTLDFATIPWQLPCGQSTLPLTMLCAQHGWLNWDPHGGTWEVWSHRDSGDSGEFPLKGTKKKTAFQPPLKTQVFFGYEGTNEFAIFFTSR